jgi:hypothetical protein
MYVYAGCAHATRGTWWRDIVRLNVMCCLVRLDCCGDEVDTLSRCCNLRLETIKGNSTASLFLSLQLGAPGSELL